MVAHAVSEKPYELAYEASIRAIENQAATVESGQALTHAGRSPVRLLSFTTGAIGLFVAVASLTLAMLLPFRLRFSLSASAILKSVDGETVTSTEALREVALQYESMHGANTRQIHLLVMCFRLAIVCLIGEVGFWLTVLARGEL